MFKEAFCLLEQRGNFAFFYLNNQMRSSKDGAVVRAFASHHCGPGFILARCHKWVEFVVGSRRAQIVFLCVLWLVSLYKNMQNSDSIRIKDPHEIQLRLMWLPL